MKIKYKSLIITFLAVILTVAFSSVYAVSDQFYYPKFRTGDTVIDGNVRWEVTHSTPIGSNDAGYFILPEEVIPGPGRTDNNRTPAYCVEAGVPARDIDSHGDFHYQVITDPARFSSLSKIPEEKLKLLCLISYFGWGTSPESAGLTDEIAMGTQLAIWDTIGGGNGIAAKATSIDGPKNWAKTILDRAKKAMLKPSFDSTETEVLIGKPVTITDSNGVLGNYTITSNTGGKYNARKSGNSLVIDGLEVGEYTITLERSFQNIKYKLGPLLFYDPVYQDIMIFGQPEKIKTQLKIKVIGIPITIQKLDEDTNEAKPLGDAKLEGAVYGIYDDNGEEVERLTLDATGKAKSKPLPPAKYTIKEIKAPEGYVLSNTSYSILLDTSDLDPTFYVKDKVMRGKVEVEKYDAVSDKTLEVPAEGAVLWLVLNDSVPGGIEDKSSSEIIELAKTNPIVYYEATIDSKGHAEFIDETYHNQHKDDPDTIPYGKYTIIEVKGSTKGSEVHYYFKPQEVEIKSQSEKRYYLLEDPPIPVSLQIQKIDKDTGEDIKIAGAEYMVWDVARKKFVEQTSSPDGKDLTVFTTLDNGMITLPQEIDAGDYIVYEIKAPEGYYLDEEYRLPENESDYGNIEKGGALFTIDKKALDIKPDSTGEKVDLYYKVEIANTPLKARLRIVKTGEQFTKVEQVTEKYNKEYDVTKPKFENKGLKGVTYEIYAAKDIKSKDGRYTYVKAGTKVDTIETKDDGVGESTKDLYCGEYRIVETVTPKGYITDKNIPNVVLENEGPEKIKTTVKELSNVRQKLSVIIDKVFEDVRYSETEELKKEAVFGIYANQDFMFSNGELAISKGTLVATTKVEEGVKQDTARIDLPAGEYYVKELESSIPYTILEEIKYATLKYEGQDERVDFGVGEFVNTLETARVTLIKLSTTSFDNVILNGSQIDTSTLSEDVQALLKVLHEKTSEEVREYLKENQPKSLAGAKYGIYRDENCTKLLYVEKEKGKYEPAIMETDDVGLISMGDVPLGTYYLQEIDPPTGYEKTDDIIKLALTVDSKDAIVYQALVDNPWVGRGIIKTDVFTGDYVENCEFVIKDALTGKEIVHSVTGTYDEDAALSEKGLGYIPLDKFVEGRKYTFTEISAPNVYDLNTEPHEFIAHFDERGEWAADPVPVQNRRKTGKVTILKTDEKTGEPLEGCKFSIVLLDENGDPYVNKDGETIYLVENAVTGEDGKYVIEEAPYGTYKFIEVEAPEGYEKAEEKMENYVFEVNENSQEVLFEVTNTGDIAVYALCAVALVSVLGIVYAIRKTKKEN